MAVRRAKYRARSLERNASAPFLTSTTSNASAAEKEISKKDPITATIQMGHEFKKTTFYKPTYCQHCSDMLWGLMNQGYQCAGMCSLYVPVQCILYYNIIWDSNSAPRPIGLILSVSN